MKLEDLMLRKEEIPILPWNNYFKVPIHPKLLDSDIKLDVNLARIIFSKAADEWYNDLKEYSKALESKDDKKWISEVFLKNPPKVIKLYQNLPNQRLDELDWSDDVLTLENGFAKSLSINRNLGGSLQFDKNEMSCKTFSTFDDSNGYIRFSKDKALEFGVGNIVTHGCSEGVDVYTYVMDNVRHYPAALFLRNWVRLYLNEAMKQVL